MAREPGWTKLVLVPLGQALEALFLAPQRLQNLRWRVFGPTLAAVIRAPTEVAGENGIFDDLPGRGVLAVVPTGEILPILELRQFKGAARIRVRLSDGREGWAHSGWERRQGGHWVGSRGCSRDNLVSIRRLRGRPSKTVSESRRAFAERMISGFELDPRDTKSERLIGDLLADEPLTILSEQHLITQLEEFVRGTVSHADLKAWGMRLEHCDLIGIRSRDVWDCLFEVQFSRERNGTDHSGVPEFTRESALAWVDRLQERSQAGR